jgi:succinate dehydrogenase / fumarate reductase, cytochrome b subunit
MNRVSWRAIADSWERSVKDVRDALIVARNTDGGLVRRPLSPHLQVYRWQISTVLSIMHRFSGIALSVGALVLVWWLVAAATSPEAFADVQWFLGSVIGYIVLIGWTIALFYHLFNGIRHLAWDAGHGFEKPTFHTTGWVVVIATFAFTLLVWIVGLAAG